MPIDDWTKEEILNVLSQVVFQSCWNQKREVCDSGFIRAYANGIRALVDCGYAEGKYGCELDDPFRGCECGEPKVI